MGPKPNGRNLFLVSRFKRAPQKYFLYLLQYGGDSGEICSRDSCERRRVRFHGTPAIYLQQSQHSIVQSPSSLSPSHFWYDNNKILGNRVVVYLHLGPNHDLGWVWHGQRRCCRFAFQHSGLAVVRNDIGFQFRVSRYAKPTKEHFSSKPRPRPKMTKEFCISELLPVWQGILNFCDVDCKQED